MKFIVFTTDIPPIQGIPTSGTALRTFGLVQGLRSAGHEVMVSVPKTALEGFRKTALGSESLQKQLKEFELLSFDSRNQADLIDSSGADAVLCGHWPALACNYKPNIPVIIDLAGPHLLERHFQGSSNQEGAILGKLNALSRADYFIVSGAKQRLYFLSYLLRAGIPDVEKRICTIPMPLPPQIPNKEISSDNFPKFIFGGVFLPWQDPSEALRFVAKDLSTRSSGKLTCIGGLHPNYPINGGVYEKLFEELSANPKVEIKPMAPYEDFIELLGHQDIAVDLMRWNIERELAVTIRSTTYLWAGVPVIYNSFADLGRLIEKYDAGWLVEPGDKESLSKILDSIHDNPEIIKDKSRNAQKLAQECFSWDQVVKPLLKLIEQHSLKNSNEIDITLDFPQNAELSVSQNTPISQEFTCRVDGFQKIEFRFATHDCANPQPIVAELHQLENDNSKCIASHVFRKDEISNNNWHALEFTPICRSAGQKFSLQFSTEKGQKHTEVSPWACNDSPYPLHKLSQGSNLIRGKALCVRTTCSPT